MKEKIGIILVNYNGKIYNKKCIESILNSTIQDRLQIIVVDNASTDDSVIELRNYWGQNDHITILEMDHNYGFAKANNEGIKWSLNHGITQFLLLNNDTEVEPYTIEKMISAQKRTGGIVVPKILYADKENTIWCAGGEFTHIIMKPRQRGLNQIDKGQYDESGICKFANGCCLLLSADIINKIGFLDEKFFLYYEDTEYSLRACSCGVNIWYCADAIVYHKVNGSTKGNERPDNFYYITRNWLICNRIHMKGRFYLFFIYFIFNRLAWVIKLFINGKFKEIFEIINGTSDFLKKKYGNKE